MTAPASSLKRVWPAKNRPVSKKAGKGESVIYWAYERALDLIGVFRRIAPSLIVVAWSFLR